MTKISIGNAPCSWGTLEFENTKGANAGYTNMLDELVETGYSGSELGDWGFMPTEPTQLAAAFRQRNIVLTGAFVPVALANAAAHAEGTTRTVEIAQLLARTADLLKSEVRPFVVLADENGKNPTRTQNAGRITQEMELSPSEWRIFADGANQVARAVYAATGLRTVFHHHCAGYVETPHEISQLLALTDPQTLGLVFDTGHYAFAAGSCDGIQNALLDYTNRIWYVHFKDCSPAVMAQAKEQKWDYFEAVAQGVFCELGKGGVDFPAVTEWLRQRNYNGFVTVEQDVLPGMGTPKASAARNREYLHSIGL